MKPELFRLALEAASPDTIADARRRHSSVTNGDRPFLHYDWAGERSGAAAVLRLQIRPRHGEVWISRLAKRLTSPAPAR